MTMISNHEMPQEDFNLVSWIVIHNFSTAIKFEKQLTGGEKLAKKLLTSTSGTAKEQRAIRTDGLGTKNVFDNFVVDVVLEGDNQFEILVSVGNDVLLQRFLPLEYGMMNSAFRELPESTFSKKVNKHSQNANQLLNIMNYALIDQFIKFNDKPDATVFKHAIEGIVLHSFGREVPYYFEFMHDRLLWRYVLSVKQVLLMDSNTVITIDFSTNNIEVDIQAHVKTQLGRLNFTTGQAMSCVASFLDSIAAGFRFKSGYITFNKAVEGKTTEESLTASSIIDQLR